MIVPYLRGYGTTRFRSDATFRNGQQSVLGVDVIALMDALGIADAIIGGSDWGARTANVVAALWPGRCTAMVSVSGYLIGSPAAGEAPLPPPAELSWWYQFYFATERGRAGYDTYRREFARLIWHTASPEWDFDDATFTRSAASLTSVRRGNARRRHHPPVHGRFPDTELTDLRRRVNATRWPEPETVTDDSQGVPLAMMQDLARYWATDYDWRKCEAKLNDLPHFITEIDGLDIHFLHVRSQHTDALPLIVTHGWPGSIIEQLKIIEPLTNPEAHGGIGAEAFHLVIPSLPGHGFSAKPAATGWDPARIAQAGSC